MADTIRTYSVTETPPHEIPRGYERISLVTDDDSGAGLYKVEDALGDFYLCDGNGDKVPDVSSWIIQRVLADIPADDPDAFFEAITTTAKEVVKEKS